MADATPLPELVMFPGGAAPEPESVGRALLVRLAWDAGLDNTEAAAERCLVALCRPANEGSRGSRRREERERERRRVLVMLGHAVAAEGEYARGANRRRAATLVSRLWSRDQGLARMPLTPSALRGREQLLARAIEYFGLVETVGPRRGRGRPAGTDQIARVTGAEAGLSELISTAHRRAEKLGIPKEEIAQVAGLALNGDLAALARLDWDAQEPDLAASRYLADIRGERETLIATPME